MSLAPDKANSTLPFEESQEVLGSVTQETQSNDRPFSIQLRTSARVSKKLKLDSQNVIPPAVTDKKETKPEENKNVESKSNTVRRVHELWSTEDKNAFFEALNEYGKDFDAIQTHMNNKRKKRGINQSISKNRDQARHFYYRTWHKISKYLKFPQEVKKAVREQYGLINFGEFRKKIGFVSEKNSVKLNELIYSGNTQVRIKGKTIRIKTPVCRALRKLNQLQETTADVKLPTRIVIELRPRNNESWCHVQSLAMNPRVRTSLPLQQQLISLVLYLQRKWQSPDVETKEKGNTACGESNGTDGRLSTDISRLLRLAPKQGVSIVAPSVRSGEFITSSRISLLAYEEKFGAEKDAIAENLKQLQSANKTGKSNRNCKKVSAEDEKCKIASEHDIQLQSKVANDGPFSDTDFVSSTVNQLLSLNSEQDASVKYGPEESDWNSPGKDEYDLDSGITATENKEEIIEKAKAGWTVENADTIRIGDLYLMFGTDCKLQLEYWWETESDSHKSKNHSSSETASNCEKSKLSESLNKLISIAKLYLNKEKEHCTCGHICKPNNKFINGRSRLVKRSKNMNSMTQNNDLDKNVNAGASETSNPKSRLPAGVLTTMNRTGLTSYAASRGVSSFKEQLDLQYYNRRRSGDKQRTLPLLPKVTIQVIKPKEEVRSEVSKKQKTETTPVDNVGISKTVTTSNECTESNLISSRLPLFGDSLSTQAQDLLLQDDDTKSSCSTITRFLKQTLPQVLPQPAARSSDGINTPVINRSVNVLLPNSDALQEGRESPTWCMSESSNFSISSLLRQFEIPLKPIAVNTVTVDEETRFSTDVETQFQRLINESSVDYTEKFANLAAQMASETQTKTLE